MLEGDKPEREGKSSSAATLEMLVTAQEAERQRLSRAMHDGPAQALSNFILQAEIAMRLFDIDHVRAREELTSLKESAMGTFQKIRNFIFEMRPMMLDDLGLVPTVKRYIETFKEQSGVDVSLAVTGTERRLENYDEVMIFRAIQELLWNAARHSQGTQIRVVMDVDEHLVKLSVKDNGRGFSTAEVAGRGGLGLKVIQERVDMVGGSMEIDSIIGQGTTVTLQIPTAIEPT
jgi:two-component system sensor histidine kinase DegS